MSRRQKHTDVAKVKRVRPDRDLDLQELGFHEATGNWKGMIPPVPERKSAKLPANSYIGRLIVGSADIYDQLKSLGNVRPIGTEEGLFQTIVVKKVARKLPMDQVDEIIARRDRNLSIPLHENHPHVFDGKTNPSVVQRYPGERIPQASLRDTAAFNSISEEVFVPFIHNMRMAVAETVELAEGASELLYGFFDDLNHEIALGSLAVFQSEIPYWEV